MNKGENEATFFWMFTVAFQPYSNSPLQRSQGYSHEAKLLQRSTWLIRVLRERTFESIFHLGPSASAFRDVVIIFTVQEPLGQLKTKELSRRKMGCSANRRCLVSPSADGKHTCVISRYLKSGVSSPCFFSTFLKFPTR